MWCDLENILPIKATNNYMCFCGTLHETLGKQKQTFPTNKPFPFLWAQIIGVHLSRVQNRGRSLNSQKKNVLLGTVDSPEARIALTAARLAAPFAHSRDLGDPFILFAKRGGGYDTGGKKGGGREGQRE